MLYQCIMCWSAVSTNIALSGAVTRHSQIRRCSHILFTPNNNATRICSSTCLIEEGSSSSFLIIQKMSLFQFITRMCYKSIWYLSCSITTAIKCAILCGRNWLLVSFQKLLLGLSFMKITSFFILGNQVKITQWKLKLICESELNNKCHV